MLQQAAYLCILAIRVQLWERSGMQIQDKGVVNADSGEKDSECGAGFLTAIA